VSKVPFGDSAKRNICMHLTKLLSDVGPLESCFGPFGDGVSVGAR
jgi:hypothetical protein